MCWTIGDGRTNKNKKLYVASFVFIAKEAHVESNHKDFSQMYWVLSPQPEPRAIGGTLKNCQMINRVVISLQMIY